MVSSFPFEGYNTRVNIQIKRFLTLFMIVIGIFIVTVATVFILTRITALQEKPGFYSALIAGSVVAVLSLPVLVWLVLSSNRLEHYSAYAIEEIELSEDDLNQAVENWVYAHHKRRMEEDARFLEDDDGNVTCRVSVRKD